MKKNLDLLYSSNASNIYINRSENKVYKVLVDEHSNFDQIKHYKNELEISNYLDLPSCRKALCLKEVNGQESLVLEYIKGESLHEYLKSKTLEFSDLVKLAIDIITIIDLVHQKGVIHKDINCTNILVADNEEIKLIDFGISTKVNEKVITQASAEILEGTLTHISPEQTGRMNRITDYRSDYYSYGIILYRLFTGNIPFKTKELNKLVYSHIAIKPEVPKEVNSVISSIIMKLLSKNAEDRYQSAQGIIYDLNLALSNKDEKFIPGKEDYSRTFKIPEKLYGREEERSKLINLFYDSCSKGTRFLLVSGYSGVGKSSLINELHKDITSKNGFYINGKFNELKKNIPYSALRDAFSEYVEFVLMQPKDNFFKIRNRIIENIGKNGKILVELIPDMKLILGKQDTYSSLGVVENEARISMVFTNFINSICSKEQPIVIFIDDLQWVDSASLDLLNLVLKNDKNNLFLIGAYRDNEVNSNHILSKFINDYQSENGEVDSIKVKNLSLESTTELLIDTLKVNNKELNRLSELVFTKTQGNPFYTKYLLKNAYNSNYIWFKDNRWNWDYNNLSLLNKSENVIELLCSNLQQLPDEALNIIKHGALIGSSFSLETLSIILDQGIDVLINRIAPALEMELVFFKDISQKHVSFYHDKIQQAVSQLIEEYYKKEIHLKIAKVLIDQKNEDDNTLYLIADQLCYALDIIPMENKVSYCSYLINAGKKAKNASAYQSGKIYLLKAKETLESDCWVNNYEQTLEIYSLLANIYFLLHETDKMDELSKTVIDKSKLYIDRVNIDILKIESFVSVGKWVESIEYAIEVLKNLGIEIPKVEDISNEVIGEFLSNTGSLIGDRKPEDLLELQINKDNESLSAMAILTLCLPAAYIAVPNLFPLIVCKMVDVSITKGNSKMSVMAYSNYGILLCGVINDVRLGYDYGQMAIKLLEQIEAYEYKTRSINNVNVFLNHWIEPLSNTVEPLKKCFYTGLESGDLVFAGYSINASLYHSVFTGTNLNSLNNDFKFFIDQLHNISQEGTYYWLKIHSQFVLNLLSKDVTKYTSLIGEAYNEELYLTNHLENNDLIALFYIFLYKSVLSYLFYDFKKAKKYTIEARKYIQGALGMPLEPIFLFYESLIDIKYSNLVSTDVQSSIDKFEKWSETGECNFLHKYYLLKAESSRVNSKHGDAREFYDLAINSIDTNSFFNEKALIYEVAGNYYLEREFFKQAKLYFNNAIIYYEKWGAINKINDLRSRYSSIIQLRKPKSDLINYSSSNSEINSTLDYLTVLNASQAISKEIDLESLIEKLMEIVITTSGADKGYFITINKQSFVIENKTYEEKQEFPIMILNYVNRSLEKVLINNIEDDVKFASDPYILKHRPKSILVIPILRNNSCNGVLYLENSTVYNVFTEKRVQILDLLSTQISISIENANIHKNLESIVESRTVKLNEKNYELEQITAKLKDSNLKLERLASIDPLTGMYNRRHFFVAAETILNNSKRNATNISLFMMDIDHFKNYNDTYGHVSGDQCLKTVSQLIKTFFQRSNDIVARYGGEEFIGIISDTSKEDVNIIANKICSRIRYEEIEHKSSDILGVITSSIGIVTVIPKDDVSLDDLIKIADEALYEAKKQGRNRVIDK